VEDRWRKLTGVRRGIAISEGGGGPLPARSGEAGSGAPGVTSFGKAQERSSWRRQKAAKLLGISRKTLHNKMVKFRLGEKAERCNPLLKDV